MFGAEMLHQILLPFVLGQAFVALKTCLLLMNDTVSSQSKSVLELFTARLAHSHMFQMHTFMDVTHPFADKHRLTEGTPAWKHTM